ncbi:MAG TPA: ATP-binding protein [Polyangia bacterium]|nr:ATP-binding protein [Polyangia bacterium]
MRRADRAGLRELRESEARLARDTATSLEAYLTSFDRDTRLLAALATTTRRLPTPERAQNAAILDAFQALATVVPQYRTVTLFHTGRPSIVAVDPTEDRARVAPALVAASERLAAEAIAGSRTVGAGPVTLDAGRSFYFYAAPAGPAEAVVVTSDAGLMLEAVSRRPGDAHGLVVVDPKGAVWLGCESHERCRLFPAGSDEAAEIVATLEAGTRDGPALAHPSVARLGLPVQAAVGVAPGVASPLGTWSVADIAPAANLEVRRRGFLRQLVMTTAGVALAILAVGWLILRQHAKAAALEARVEAAEEVARLQRQLVRAEKLVTVGVLSAGIAHDIGTPLAVVRGRAEHMLERRMDRRDVEDLRSVVGEIDRISSTIRQVLDFSREQPVAMGRTDARAAIVRALELLEWRVAAKHVVVEIDAPAGLPPLAAAADHLEQVLVNLLLNACDASRPGGVIRVSAGLDGARQGRLRIEVADRGGGIPPHHLNAVFDPYFTTKARGEGTGLGLAIVSQIVRSHRGEIALRSTVGLGTVVALSWPLAPAAPEGRLRVA